jgi:hypothetical protein
MLNTSLPSYCLVALLPQTRTPESRKNKILILSFLASRLPGTV